jgi:hypothetical protein
MHDALARMQADANEALRNWSDRVLALVDGHLAGRRGTLDPQPLAGALAEAAYWSAAPRARDVAGQAAPYRRIPLADHPARGYEALLILWPPGHATPIHDHAGLWGIELVLDGVLEVEAFALSLQQPAPRLVAGDRTMLGVGDHAAFSGTGYAHRCRNLSAQQPALSLHVYGGGLDAYRSFHRQADGDWVGIEQRARREPALA